MKTKILLAFFAVAVMLGFSERASAVQIHYRDTLKNKDEQINFRKALEIAPETFVYDEYTADGSSYAIAKGFRFNESMKRTLNCEIVANTPKLQKKMKRLFMLVKPLGASGDLKVTYRTVKQGIIVDYYITNIRIWGIKASSKAVKDIEEKTE